MSEKTLGWIGASEGIRTLDTHVGNVMLYQAELRSLPNRLEQITEIPPECKSCFAEIRSADAGNLNAPYGRGAMTRVFSAIVAAGKASTAGMFACHHCSASSEVQVTANAHPASAWSRTSALGGRSGRAIWPGTA